MSLTRIRWRLADRLRPHEWPSTAAQHGVLLDELRYAVERQLDEATIIERDDETGLVVATKDGRVYGLAFNCESGRDVLGVTELEPGGMET